MNRLLFVLLALPLSVFAEGGLPGQPYLYVTEAAIEKPVDIVFLRFDLVARNAEQTKANQEVQAKAKRILAWLDERKVAKADIIAKDLNSYPSMRTKTQANAAKSLVIASPDHSTSRSTISPPSVSWSMNCSRLLAWNSPASTVGFPMKRKCKRTFGRRR